MNVNNRWRCDLDLVQFIRKAGEKRVVFDFSNLHGRCLSMLVSFSENIHSRHSGSLF